MNRRDISSLLVSLALSGILLAASCAESSPKNPTEPPRITSTSVAASSLPASTTTPATSPFVAESPLPTSPLTPPTATATVESPLPASPLTPPTATATAESPLPSNSSTPPAATAVAESPLSPPPANTTRLPSAPQYTYSVLNTYPHDPNAFTQGLVYQDGWFYEGTGLRGRSSLRKVDLETGQVIQMLELPERYFGEGVTIFGDRIIQLTWKSNVGFVYDRDSFEWLQAFYYPTEGWGITHDGERLIMSDGTATLHFLNPETLEEIGQVRVYDQAGPVTRLNELEFIQGEVYANVWRTDRIARIDPHTGQVTGWIELAGLLGAEDREQPVDVLNGIAYDEENDRLFVTGKLWPKLFEIEVIEQD